jgi:hypothetical protein
LFCLPLVLSLTTHLIHVLICSEKPHTSVSKKEDEEEGAEE